MPVIALFGAIVVVVVLAFYAALYFLLRALVLGYYRVRYWL